MPPAEGVTPVAALQGEARAATEAGVGARRGGGPGPLRPRAAGTVRPAATRAPGPGAGRADRRGRRPRRRLRGGAGLTPGLALAAQGPGAQPGAAVTYAGRDRGGTRRHSSRHGRPVYRRPADALPGPGARPGDAGAGALRALAAAATLVGDHAPHHVDVDEVRRRTARLARQADYRRILSGGFFGREDEFGQLVEFLFGSAPPPRRRRCGRRGSGVPVVWASPRCSPPRVWSSSPGTATRFSSIWTSTAATGSDPLRQPRPGSLPAGRRVPIPSPTATWRITASAFEPRSETRWRPRTRRRRCGNRSRPRPRPPRRARSCGALSRGCARTGGQSSSCWTPARRCRPEGCTTGPAWRCG